MSAANETMKAITLRGHGGPDVLELTEQIRPYPGEGQLLVKVAAAGVNRPDILQRMGLYPPPKGHSELLGLEVAGIVETAGRGTGKFSAGDQVTALVNGGGYAEYCLVEEGCALPIPDGLSMIEAAALPETFFTVWHNAFERGGLKPGKWLLVHGGSSGIGTTAIQMAKALGSKVIVTAGSQDKCEACLRLGADRAVNYLKEDFVAAVKEATGGGGVNTILDMVGGDYIERNFKAAAFDGRIVQIAFLNGPTADVNFMALMLKRLTLTGSTLRARTNDFKAGIGKSLVDTIWPLIESKKIQPVIDSTFPLSQARQAHQRMESSQHIGKIMLTV